jgi:hypothetical protein
VLASSAVAVSLYLGIRPGSSHSPSLQAGSALRCAAATAEGWRVGAAAAAGGEQGGGRAVGEELRHLHAIQEPGARS